MDKSKELMCLKALETVLSSKFSSSEYCINGLKDSAVCLINRDDSWIVLEKERRREYDIKVFDTIVEACLEMINRMALDGSCTQIKNQFINSILAQDTTRITA